MARTLISQKWQDLIRDRMDNGATITVTSSFKPGMQWLVQEMVRRCIPYKVTNCGLGVSTITTAVSVCPLCKRNI